MAYSQVGIVNMAYALIGEGTISSISGTDAKSILAAQVWDFILDEVLCAHEWNFAKKRVDLVQDATAPEGEEYNYRYPLPSDYLKVRKIEPALTDYKIEAGYLLTNYDNTDGDDITLHYTRRETNPAMFPAMFVTCLYCRLAAQVSFKQVRGSSNVQDRMFALYDRALIQAIGTNQSEDYVEDEAGSTSWIDAGRGGFNDASTLESN